MGIEPSPPGVRFLDHTADVGLEAHAASPELLFHRAALGTLWLVEGAPQEGARREGGGGEEGRETRALTLEAHDPPKLLRAWLRELLWWHEVEGVSYRDARFETLETGRLEARVEVAPASPRPLREIKGVTLHGLRVEAGEEGEWRARVIFDV